MKNLLKPIGLVSGFLFWSGLKQMNIRSTVLTLLLCFVTAVVVAQSVPGNLKGVVSSDGEAVEFARVVVKKNGEFVSGTQTDESGKFNFPNLEPGQYTIEVMNSGTTKTFNALIESGLTFELKAELGTSGPVLDDVVIVADQLMKVDNTSKTDTKTLEDIRKLSTRGTGGIISVGSGVQTKDDGDAISVRGGRSDNVQTYVDGVRVIGSSGLPQVALKSVSLISSGTPPWYGDVTSGVIEIETADPTPKLSVSGELLTSQFLDPYGYNLAALSLSGPILKGPAYQISPEDSAKGIRPEIVTKIGYFLSAEFESLKDRDPAGIDIWKLKDGAKDQLRNDPIRPIVKGGELSFINATDFLTKDYFETTKTKENNDLRNISVTGRLDFKLSKKVLTPTYLKIGGSYRKSIGNTWTLSNSLFSPENNEHRTQQDIRVFGRFTQSFIPADPDKVVLKNLMYNLQADYSRVNVKLFNEDWMDDVFKYGHVGQFGKAGVINRQNMAQIGQMGEAFVPIDFESPMHNPNYTSDTYWQTAGFADTAYSFNSANSSNPLYANYNNSIYRYLQNNPQPFLNPFFFTSAGELRGNVQSLNQLVNFNGILNGRDASNNYSLFSMPGNVYNGYAKFQNELFRVTGYATFGLGRKKSVDKDSEKITGEKSESGIHTFRVGFEFDQRTERSYSLGAANLWNLMRNLTNKHLTELDSRVASQSPIYAKGPDGKMYFQDTVLLNRLYVPASQSNFDKNLRNKLGLPVDGLDYINVDYFDPNTFNLDMFTAEELFAGGKPTVSYYGYDYKGGTTSRASDQSFFTDLTNRPMNAFSPTYVSGYIQDKFEMENVYFTLGLRVDRLDLNQKVLKDRYSMVPTWTAKEAADAGGYQLPSTIGDDYVPYVSERPTEGSSPNFTFDKIRGYRNGDRWLDKNGAPVDPELLKVGGKVLPYIKQDSIGYESFKDYEPQVNVMPRVSFSFKLSERANFFAHYDVLTQRPTTNRTLQYTDFIFIQQNATSVIDNPSLKPSQTVDYEVGYQQLLDQDGDLMISISAFYREMRNMIQFFRYQNAYPTTYDSYENLDFGTVKGFTFDFKTRPNRLVSMRLSYTLQFAQGTGSSANSGRNAVQGLTGFSVIRTLLPFDFDQRHTFTGNVSLSFDDNKRMGPKIFGKHVFKNSSASLTFRAGTGTPYTRNAIPNQADVQGGVNATVQTQGNPNGSRYPFNYNIDLRLDKSFGFHVGGSKETGEDGKTSYKGGRNVDLDFYLVFLNLFNIQNVLGVYGYSGQATTSGFLESIQGAQIAAKQNDPTAFVDQFRIKERSPDFYNLPRRIRLGLIFSF